MRAPTLIRTARLGAGKLLIKKFSRAATLPPVPTEKDVPVREADTLQEVVEWGKLVDEYAKISNMSKADAARVLAAYRTTKSIAGFELHTKKVIFDAVGDNLQYLKQMLNNEIGAELTVREPMYKTTYLDPIMRTIEGYVDERNEMFSEFRREFSSRMDELVTVRDRKFADQGEKLDEVRDLVKLLTKNVAILSKNVNSNTNKLSGFDRLKDSAALHIFGGAAALLGVLYYGASYVHADAPKPTLARALSDAIAPPKLPPKDGSNLEKMMNNMTVGGDERSEPLPANGEIPVEVLAKIVDDDTFWNAPRQVQPFWPQHVQPFDAVVPRARPVLESQGSSTNTVGLEQTINVHGHTIDVDRSDKEKPSMIIDGSDVKFYLQVRDEQPSGKLKRPRQADGDEIYGRLMNRQKKGSATQKSHGEFSLDDQREIEAVMQWGAKELVKNGQTTAERGVTIKTGVTKLPLSLNDETAEGKAAAQVLKKVLSQSLASFRIDQAVEKATTPKGSPPA